MFLLFSKRRRSVARYLSIEEVATALGTTDRTVRRMLNDGRLPGSQAKEKGKMVWRVHATKDLLEKLERLYGASTVSVDSFDIHDEEEFNAPTPEESAPGVESTSSKTASSGAWHLDELERLKVVAEELAKALLKPMSEKLEYQSRTIVEQEKEIENLQRQARLLPDLQRQAHSSEEALKLKHAENEALLKQIEALKEHLEAETQKVSESEQFKEQVSSLSEQIKALQRPWWKKMFGDAN
jgi:excisionase family DNA binding protein